MGCVVSEQVFQGLRWGKFYDILLLDCLAHLHEDLERILEHTDSLNKKKNVSVVQFYILKLSIFWNKQLSYVSLVVNTGKIKYACIQYFLTQG